MKITTVMTKTKKKMVMMIMMMMMMMMTMKKILTVDEKNFHHVLWTG